MSWDSRKRCILFISLVNLSFTDQRQWSAEDFCTRGTCQNQPYSTFWDRCGGGAEQVPVAAGEFCQTRGHVSRGEINNNEEEQGRRGTNTVGNIQNWGFPNSNLILETFPVDPIKENYVRRVQNVVFSKVLPTPLKHAPKLVAVWENVLSGIFDLDQSVTETELFTAFVAGNTFLDGSVPLAHRYGGHQFGGWSGQLGDGRAHLLGEFVNGRGERWELQLKGSGKTPYSRRGDGRAVLRSSVREFLASEAMHHLGIPTSRALSLVMSEDPVWRDQFYDGHPQAEKAAVVLRMAPSWFRIGSLEILAKSGELELLQTLADFLIKHHFPLIDPGDGDRYLSLFSRVVLQTADMIARWQSVGFAHGVMNTDNFSILSLTIDYGPFGFLDEYNPKFVPNTSDDEGMYSFEKQPDVGVFNLRKLGEALSPLLSVLQRKQLPLILAGYADAFKERFMELFRLKLGLTGSREQDKDLVAILLMMMEETKSDYAMTFRQLGSVSMATLQSSSTPDFGDDLWALKDLSTHGRFLEWAHMYAERLQAEADFDDENRKNRMNALNPKYILRNWMSQSAIEAANEGDFTVIHDLQQILSRPFDDQAEGDEKGYASRPPRWAKDIKVSCSS